MAPAAPAFKDMPNNRAYREALLNTDLVITDSAFMVLLWTLMEREIIRRISGLAFLSAALAREVIRRPTRSGLWLARRARAAISTGLRRKAFPCLIPVYIWLVCMGTL